MQRSPRSAPTLKKKFQDKIQGTFILNKGENDKGALEKPRGLNLRWLQDSNQRLCGSDPIV
jgi:hypothetical protein